MSNKMPYLQFYPADWTADTRILSLAARAAWFELILAMHVRGQADSVTGTPARIAGLIGCSEEEFLPILEELKANDICDIVTDCNGDVTLTCRRLKNANSERKKTADRVRKFRCNADVTPRARNPEPEPDKESISVGDTKESTPAPDESGDIFPQSKEEVIELAKSPVVGLPCTPEQADAYFTDRVIKDWTPYGQARLKTRQQVAFDLKKWLVRDQNEKRERKKNDVRKFEGTGYDETADGSDF